MERPEEEKDISLKRGYGSPKKFKVLIMVKSTPSQDSSLKGKPPQSVGHLKIPIISDLKTQTITDAAKKHVRTSIELTTNDSISHYKLGEHV